MSVKLVNSLLFCLSFCLLSLLAFSASAARCLYISSYHQGYAWSDGVEQGVVETLQGKCELKLHDMDTKRNKSEAFKKQAAQEARALIEAWQPDVVITSDDNAARYLIKPFYRDAALPFVFCGVNWTVSEYGFPYKNVTGMIEVAPIASLFERAGQFLPSLNRALYIGANTATEEKNLKRFLEEGERRQIVVDSLLADSVDQWLEGYRRGQDYDLIIVGSHSGIADWAGNSEADRDRVLRGMEDVTGVLSMTSHGWMMPYSMVGLTKVPAEQGQGAAQIALSILDGVQPDSIPIVPNRKWDIWANMELLEAADIRLPRKFLRRAKKHQ